jgi:serine/threonine protein kinase
MNSQTNYQISSSIYESANSLVYQAFFQDNNQPLIVKILKQDYPSPEELTRYKQEYEIVRSLEKKGVKGTVKAYALQAYQNTLAMLLEDFGGKSLKTSIGDNPFSLEGISHDCDQNCREFGVNSRVEYYS